MKDKKKIFLIGGSGFIGKNLVRCLSPYYQISIFDKYIDHDFFADYPSVNVYQLDLVADNIPSEIIAPDYIINLASIVTAERDLSLFDELISSNLKVLLNLYERFKDTSSLKLFIQFGSSEEYGSISSPFKEENREYPNSPYALVKQLTTNTALMLLKLPELIIGELFTTPVVLRIVGIVIAVLGVVTPLPWYVFVPLGAGLIAISAVMTQKQAVAEIEEEAENADMEAKEVRKPENVVSLLQVDPIELEFGYGIIPLADVNQGGDLLDRVVMIRRQVALELGTIVPIIRLRDNIQLNPNQYIIKIKGIQVSEGEILFDHYMAMNPGFVEEEISGIPTFEPSFHLPAIWITENQRERAESLGYTVVDPPSIIATHLTEVIKSHIAELLTRQDTQNLINNLKENNPTLVEELVPKLMGVGEIQKVLQNLLAEGISIRDLLTIFESLADHAGTTRDTDVLTEYARQSLKRAISNKYFPGNETTRVITLDPAVEQEIMGSVKQTEQGGYINLAPDKIRQIVNSVKTELAKLEDMGANPIIVTSPIVRIYFKKIINDYFKDVAVISYNEIESDVELQSVGMVTI